MDLKNLSFKYWQILSLIGLSALITWPIFMPGYFSHHDDLQVMRIFEMRRCLEDLQIPCRWVPDMGYGNGYPLFNYYSVLPYYIGAFLSFFIGYIAAAKILFLIPLILGGIAMYFLAAEIFGKTPGILSAALFLFAPYKALDTYVRGAVAENFAMAIFPFTLYFALKLIKTYSVTYFIGLSLSFAVFLVSHNIMVLLFAPVFAIFVLYWLWINKWKNIKILIIALSLGIGLSSFFTVPAFFEKDLVQIENLVRLDLDFRAHFVTIHQLFFERSWGYGASFPGVEDTISFQIGWPHWILAALSILTFILKKNRRISFIYLALLLFFVLSLFMTHNKSAFIWEKIGILRFVQFPWRFLALTIFTSSLMSGFLLNSLKPSLVKVTFFVLVLSTVLLNWDYFKPEKFYPYLTDGEKLSGELWDTQQKASILDYLPKGAIESKEAAGDKPIIVTGDAVIDYFKNTSAAWEANINARSPSLIEFPIYDFPNWKVIEGGKEIEHSSDNYLGRISIMLNEGNHMISGKFTDTPVRRVSNIISFVSIILVLYLIYYESRKNFK